MKALRPLAMASRQQQSLRSGTHTHNQHVDVRSCICMAVSCNKLRHTSTAPCMWRCTESVANLLHVLVLRKDLFAPQHLFPSALRAEPQIVCCGAEVLYVKKIQEG
eukprot:3662087-Amphidinium_carterae.1